MKKTLHKQGESWVPDQSLDDDQSIRIQKIKLKDLQKELHAAEAEGIVIQLSLQSVATGITLGSQSLWAAPPPKKGWF